MRILTLILAIILILPGLTHAQQEIILCEGSGVHCMTVDIEGMRLSLVKSKSKPEIRIREN